jgi:hypothetical protein
MSARKFLEAVSWYSAALSLDPPTLWSLPVLFAKRSKARAGMGSWQDALNDANEVPHLFLSKVVFFN